MFLLTKPTTDRIDDFLNQREARHILLPRRRATRESTPLQRYNIDHNRQLLGSGEQVFEKAKTAVRQWKMFEVPGLELFYPDTPIEPGRNVAPLAHHLGFWSLNSCRIVYVIDEPDRFGFAYGTLTEHVEIGEERFTVEFHPDTGEVWYDIFAFSRPGSRLIKLGYPYSRYKQKQFAVGSKAAMFRASQ